MTRREIHSLKDVLAQFATHSAIGPIARMWAVTMQEAFTDNAFSSEVKQLRNKCLALLETMFDANVDKALDADLIDVEALLFFMTGLEPGEYDKLAGEALKLGYIRHYARAAPLPCRIQALPTGSLEGNKSYYGQALMF